MWAFIRANWWRILLVLPVLWVLLILWLKWRQMAAAETDWRAAVLRREQLLAVYRESLDIVRAGGEEAEQRVEDRYHDKLQELNRETKEALQLLEDDRAAFAEAASSAWGGWRAKAPSLLLVCLAGAFLLPATADAQVHQTVPLRQGDVASRSGVLVIGSPQGLIDLTSAGGAGWWVPDRYLQDATICFKGCDGRVQAERDRAEGLVQAAKDEGAGLLRACDASCAERLADLAKPDPFPWRTVLLVGSGSLALGAVAGVLLASYL